MLNFIVVVVEVAIIERKHIEFMDFAMYIIGQKAENLLYITHFIKVKIEKIISK